MPSAADSNFTRLAKGLVCEIEAEKSRQQAPLEGEEIHVGTKESRPTQSMCEKKAIPSKHRQSCHHYDPLTKRYCKQLCVLALQTWLGHLVCDLGAKLVNVLGACCEERPIVGGLLAQLYGGSMWIKKNRPDKEHNRLRVCMDICEAWCHRGTHSWTTDGRGRS